MKEVWKKKTLKDFLKNVIVFKTLLLFTSFYIIPSLLSVDIWWTKTGISKSTLQTSCTTYCTLPPSTADALYKLMGHPRTASVYCCWIVISASVCCPSQHCSSVLLCSGFHFLFARINTPQFGLAIQLQFPCCCAQPATPHVQSWTPPLWPALSWLNIPQSLTILQ